MSPGLAGLGTYGAWDSWVGSRGLGFTGLVVRGVCGSRGLRLAGLIEFGLAGLVSCWVHLIPPGSASAPLTEHASSWIGIGSSESALSGLSQLSFMTLEQ